VIELPATSIQADAITDAAARRGLSVTDWAMDCLLTYAANHLGRSLADWVATEQEYTQRGDYPACGATHTVGQGTPAEHTLTCVRIKNHQREAVASRQAHVGYMPDMTTLTSWEHDR